MNKIDELKQIIKNSKFYTEIKHSLHNHEFKRIRCLALGSPIESSNSRYQYALLLLLIELLNIKEISIYDPIFNEKDKELLRNFKIEETYPYPKDENTLFYMPHLPLKIMEQIINTEKPVYFIGNDIVSHTDRLSKQKLNELYPSMSILLHLLNDSTNNDGFTKVIKRRKQYKEPEINYDYNSVYFKDIEIKRYLNNFNKTDPWGTSFSDLAFHKLKI
ncbi:uncharacterized protein KGF55_001994 [Candida pseudojiufengensis]|uniref:uncharacterized protein n=1 Tax=Candida pseudojiufengensis TaxID=497109 RepID=UPI0022257EBC|nr:uncharacterized protein KGF55_001994 [Candida pseudojiufengensis]KAI5964052.1 hypothetical protein KGF55_001994 [Candida pseudojiufengensis]